MTAKEYLNQAWELKENIKSKREQIEVIRAIGERATSSYSAQRSGGTNRRSKVEDAVTRIGELEDDIADDIIRFEDKYREIAAVIDAVDNPTHRRLLSLRYLSFKKWEDIAEAMNYSWRNVHYKHSAALNEVCIVLHTKRLL